MIRVLTFALSTPRGGWSETRGVVSAGAWYRNTTHTPHTHQHHTHTPKTTPTHTHTHTNTHTSPHHTTHTHLTSPHHTTHTLTHTHITHKHTPPHHTHPTAHTPHTHKLTHFTPFPFVAPSLSPCLPTLPVATMCCWKETSSLSLTNDDRSVAARLTGSLIPQPDRRGLKLSKPPLGQDNPV